MKIYNRIILCESMNQAENDGGNGGGGVHCDDDHMRYTKATDHRWGCSTDK